MKNQVSKSFTLSIISLFLIALITPAHAMVETYIGNIMSVQAIVTPELSSNWTSFNNGNGTNQIAYAEPEGQPVLTGVSVIPGSTAIAVMNVTDNGDNGLLENLTVQFNDSQSDFINGGNGFNGTGADINGSELTSVTLQSAATGYSAASSPPFNCVFSPSGPNAIICTTQVSLQPITSWPGNIETLSFTMSPDYNPNDTLNIEAYWTPSN